MTAPRGFDPLSLALDRAIKRGAKRGPRKPTEFLRFKAAIDKAERQNREKKAAALEFTNGDRKKAEALLKKYYRHRELPE